MPLPPCSTWRCTPSVWPGFSRRYLRRQGISLSYLEQLFAKLRRGNLVVSVRGPGGGYQLSRDMTGIHVAR